MNRLIIVTGAPGTGKTTLALDLSRRLGLPVLSRDDLKERLFDRIGWKDRRGEYGYQADPGSKLRRQQAVAQTDGA